MGRGKSKDPKNGLIPGIYAFLFKEIVYDTGKKRTKTY